MSDTRFTAADEERDRRESEGEGRSEATDEATMSPERLDVLLDALGDPRRRLIVEYVRDDEPATLSDLAAHVAERESPDRPAADAIEIELYHSHLPRLVEADLLAYDDDRRTVRRGEQFDATELLE